MMIAKDQPTLSFSLIIIVAILVSACGGSDFEPNANGGNNPPSGDINPGVPGKLFFVEGSKGSLVSRGNEYSAWLMDIVTGKYTKVPNTDWNSQRDRFPGNFDRDFWSSPVKDGTAFVTKVLDCKDSPDRTCVVMQNMDGTYFGQFDILGDDIRSVRMSQDLQYIALFDQPGMSVSSARWLEIYGRDGGEPLSRSKLEDNYVFELEWLADGRIVYGIWRKFYFTAAYSAQVEYTMTLPDDLQGEEIGSITASPDGGRLAFTVDKIPYIMNVDGTRIRELARNLYSDENGVGTNVNGIAWSPDGQWVMLAEGNNIAPTPDGWSASRRFYVVPAEDMGKVFSLSFIDEERSPEVRLLHRYWYSDNPTNTNGNITDRAFSATVYWLP